MWAPLWYLCRLLLPPLLWLPFLAIFFAAVGSAALYVQAYDQQTAALGIATPVPGPPEAHDRLRSEFRHFRASTVGDPSLREAALESSVKQIKQVSSAGSSSSGALLANAYSRLGSVCDSYLADSAAYVKFRSVLQGFLSETDVKPLVLSVVAFLVLYTEDVLLGDVLIDYNPWWCMYAITSAIIVGCARLLLWLFWLLWSLVQQSSSAAAVVGTAVPSPILTTAPSVGPGPTPHSLRTQVPEGAGGSMAVGREGVLALLFSRDSWFSFAIGVITTAVVFRFGCGGGGRQPSPPITPLVVDTVDAASEMSGSGVSEPVPTPGSFHPPSPDSIPSISGLSVDTSLSLPQSVWSEYKPGERRQRLKEQRLARASAFQDRAMQQLLALTGPQSDKFAATVLPPPPSSRLEKEEEEEEDY